MGTVLGFGFDIKQALTSSYQPLPARSIFLLASTLVHVVHDDIGRCEAAGLRKHRQWVENNYTIPRGDGSSVRDIAASHAASTAVVGLRKLIQPASAGGDSVQA